MGNDVRGLTVVSGSLMGCVLGDSEPPPRPTHPVRPGGTKDGVMSPPRRLDNEPWMQHGPRNGHPVGSPYREAPVRWQDPFTADYIRNMTAVARPETERLLVEVFDRAAKEMIVDLARTGMGNFVVVSKYTMDSAVIEALAPEEFKALHSRGVKPLKDVGAFTKVIAERVAKLYEDRGFKTKVQDPTTDCSSAELTIKW